MDEVARVFTLDEANALVPTLEIEFSRVARLRSELRPLVESLGGADAAVDILQHGGRPIHGREPDAVRLKHLADEIAAAVARVNDLGCLVKDLDLGLVDFFAMQENEPVFLCWQFGEPAVAHWHPVDGGFDSRKPIEGVEIDPPEFLN